MEASRWWLFPLQWGSIQGSVPYISKYMQEAVWASVAMEEGKCFKILRPALSYDRGLSQPMTELDVLYSPMIDLDMT